MAEAGASGPLVASGILLDDGDVRPSGWSRELWFGLVCAGLLAFLVAVEFASLACALIGAGVAAAAEELTELKSKALE